jgi:two-component system response regulator AtoC
LERACSHATSTRPPSALPVSPAPPFVHINCSALPASLIESELFGHEKGAFTDARAAREGLFEMADGGTIFLDEIGDMLLELQAKLLTVLERGIVRRVGGSREISVRVRVIAATNQDLERRAADGTFRRDLLYRLNAFTVRIPALREREDDAATIAQTTLARLAREYGRPDVRLSPDAIDAIRAHTWPGNVREVLNAMQRVAMLSENELVRAEDLGLVQAADPLEVSNDREPDRTGTTELAGLTFDFESASCTFTDVERELMKQALAKTRGNVSRAAKLIGMQRSSFRYRIERYGLESFVREVSQ